MEDMAKDLPAPWTRDSVRVHSGHERTMKKPHLTIVIKLGTWPSEMHALCTVF